MSYSSHLAAIPRLPFGVYPTPLEELSRLRAALQAEGCTVPRLFIKRDDYTGAGFGGNKVRKLEYVLAQAMNDGAEVAITTGGEKSNHARVTAMLCARLGLRCILVANPATPGTMPPGLKPASMYVNELVGAEIQRINHRAERAATVAALAAQLRAEGKRVIEIPLGASIPLGAVGFVRAMQETNAQCDALELKLDYVFHASSSGGTQAGIVAGAALCGWNEKRVIGISPDDPAAGIEATVEAIARGVFDLLALAPPPDLRARVTVLDDYVGAGYGIPTTASTEALQLLARTEGIVLDPVYTAKAMAALLDWIRRGKFQESDNLLFWHTGGQLALFFTPA
jgi:1-aminocyclopropane-1-carboxylate deaminase/D-cysteine desulfhydrase-like pyridoxal-dependent ACC family enzyme